MREIPFVDLKAGFAPIRDEVMQAIDSVLGSMQLYLGPNCQALEREFADYCGSRFGVGVGSGTEAIQFSLLACGVGPGDEVITSPHTFFATAEAIACIGARPVFVDIDPVAFTMDAGAIEERITARTRAVVPVHMYGQMADMAPILEVCARHGLPVIEDACQAHGAQYGKRRAGAVGAAGCFSFYFTKNLGGYGEGGMIITDDEGIAERLRLFRNHGHRSKYEHEVVGYNGRLDEIQAAILRIRLRSLDDYNRLRRDRAARYAELLKDLPLVLPAEASGRTHVYHLYVVRSAARDSLQEHLGRRGIGTGIHYKNPLHLQPALAGLGYRRGDFPHVELVCGEILSLPMYPELDDESQEYIAASVREYFDGAA